MNAENVTMKHSDTRNMTSRMLVFKVDLLCEDSNILGLVTYTGTKVKSAEESNKNLP